MIWCLGMYASGSTWLFNAARAAASTVQSRPVAARYAETLEALDGLDETSLNIVKTHDLPRAAAAFMAAHADKILISLRDPRDAVASLMRYMRHRFPQALERVEKSAALCRQCSADERAVIFRYEAGFTDERASFDRLAEIFSGTLSEAQRAELFSASRRGAIEARIAQLERLPTMLHDARSGDMLDTDTQWHRHHAGRSGEVGRWRAELPDEAARLVEQRMGGWMRQFGYLP